MTGVQTCALPISYVEKTLLYYVDIVTFIKTQDGFINVLRDIQMFDLSKLDPAEIPILEELDCFN